MLLLVGQNNVAVCFLISFTLYYQKLTVDVSALQPRNRVRCLSFCCDFLEFDLA